MVLSNAVRHRSGGGGGGGSAPNSPSPNGGNNGVAISIKSSDSNISSSSTKIHGGQRFTTASRTLRGANNSNKNLFVLGGSLLVLAICLLGMWSTSSSTDYNSTKPQIKTYVHPRPKQSKVDRYTKQAITDKLNVVELKNKQKRPHQRQRGNGGYRKEKEELFPIPNVNENSRERVIKKGHSTYEEESTVKHVSERDKYKDEPEVKEIESKDSNYVEQEVLESESKESEEEQEAEEKAGKHYKNSKNNNDDDDENRAKDSEDSDENEDSHEDNASSGSMSNNPAEKEAKSVLSGESASSRIKPRMVRLKFETYFPTRDRRAIGGDRESKKNDLNHKNVLLTKVVTLPTYEAADMPISDRYVTIYPDDDEYIERVEKVKNSKKYARTGREPLEDDKCKPRHEWQKGAFPNCNVLHEYELGALSGMFGRAVRKKLHKLEGDGDELVKYLAHGYWRDVWLVSKGSGSFETEYDKESDYDEEITVLKTLRYRHDFTDRNYDRHRKDALASERLSASPNVVDIFAYCSNSAVYEYGKGGDIDGVLWPYDKQEDKYHIADIPSLEKIEMAYQVAQAIADMHDVEDDGYASIAHTDITPSQFIYINGRWKMNDFNRCRFMRQYKNDDSACGFYVGANPGKFRAPEEYNYDEEDEMIDVYSMGNVFYTILSGEMPFEGQKESKAQKKVMDGIRPSIPSEVLEDEDIAIKALVSATKQCWAQEPNDRPKASKIAKELKEVLARVRIQVQLEKGKKKEDKRRSREEESNE